MVGCDSNEFYQTSETFSANRIIAQNKLEGILQMCNLKHLKSVCVEKIVIIKDQYGYSQIEDYILSKNKIKDGLFN